MDFSKNFKFDPMFTSSLSEKVDVKANGVCKLIQWGKPVETIFAKDFATPELFRARAMELKNFPKASNPHKLFGTGEFSGKPHAFRLV